MANRKIPGPTYDNETKNKILDEATKLIALKGFGAVSMRDIAGAAEIQMSTIYYHYKGKEALMEDILSRFENGYRHYFNWLKDANSKAKSLEELMDNMFNREVLEMLDPMGCLGLSLTIKEQHNNESARKLVFELFYECSIKYMQADFDRLIKEGIIPPSDTKTISTLLMFYVMVGNEILIHENTGVKPPVNCVELYDGLKKFITSALTKGV